MPDTTAPSTTRSGKVLITPDDTTPWYALRLFSRNLRATMGILDREECTYFVPMRYRERPVPAGDSNKKPKLVLAPVVSNLLFLKRTANQQTVQQFLDEQCINAQIMPKERGSRVAYEIPTREMRELIYICDPDRVLYEIISTEEAAMRHGTDVIVTHGPLKGYRGRLVRKQHLHYLLRLYTGFAILVKVTKWCCKPADK